MNKEDHYQYLIRLFHSAPINQQVFDSSELKLSDGKAEYSLTVQEEYYHGAEAMHGAVYFKMLDDAAYFAVATQVDDAFLVTKSFSLDFLRPVVAGKLTAKGQLISEEEGIFHAQSEILNEQGKLVGRGNGVFVRSSKKLQELPIED